MKEVKIYLSDDYSDEHIKCDCGEFIIENGNPRHGFYYVGEDDERLMQKNYCIYCAVNMNYKEV